MSEQLRVVAAVDKFRGTATAREVARAIGSACWELGLDCDEVPLADGGEGLLDVLGGANRTSTVTGPLGEPVTVSWRLRDRTAVIESAQAIGLLVAGGPEGNDPMAATTTGVGELIDEALTADARRIIVGLGGSATTDGGLGAVRAVSAPARLRRVELIVACDVTTKFVDAAGEFGPQKGASAAQVAMLAGRLARVAQILRDEHGVDVTDLPGSGAAGGLAGGLAALGGHITSGFDVVADEVDLDGRVEAADLVLTGEGRLDSTSFEGKVVGGVAAVADRADVEVRAIVGDADPVARRRLPCDALVDHFDLERALSEPLTCIEHVARSVLTRVVDERRRSG